MPKPAQSLTKVRAAQRKVIAQLAQVREVNGVGITRVGDGYGLKVNLAAQPKRQVQLPQEIDGVPIRVEVVGPIRARGTG
jgi:endonuclease YncB( thermonuclease family)